MNVNTLPLHYQKQFHKITRCYQNTYPAQYCIILAQSMTEQENIFSFINGLKSYYYEGDQKMVDYSKQMKGSRGIVDTADYIGHSKLCRHSSTTNFELFDMFIRSLNYYKDLFEICFDPDSRQNHSHNPLHSILHRVIIIPLPSHKVLDTLDPGL